MKQQKHRFFLKNECFFVLGSRKPPNGRAFKKPHMCIYKNKPYFFEKTCFSVRLFHRVFHKLWKKVLKSFPRRLFSAFPRNSEICRKQQKSHRQRYFFLLKRFKKKTFETIQKTVRFFHKRTFEVSTVVVTCGSIQRRSRKITAKVFKISCRRNHRTVISTE